MEFYRIDDCTLRIDLTKSEAAGIFNDPSELEVVGSEARRRVLSLLDEATRRGMGDFSAQEIKIQLFAGANGGYRMDISTLSGADLLFFSVDAIPLLRLKTALNHLKSGAICTRYLTEKGVFLRIVGEIPPLVYDFASPLSISGERALPWLTEHAIPLPEGAEMI